MANNLKSFVTVNANDDAINELNRRLEMCDTNDILSFAKAFYNDVDVASDGKSVMNEWSLDNLGSKWNYLYDIIDNNQFSMESAWYPPQDFFSHLFKLMYDIDPEVSIEVLYEDEGYDPIGAFVYTKDSEGNLVYAHDSDDEMEDPTLEMDWDDEGYEDAQMEFMDSIYERQQEMLAYCKEMIDDNEGENIFELKEETKS